MSGGMLYWSSLPVYASSSDAIQVIDLAFWEISFL